MTEELIKNMSEEIFEKMSNEELIHSLQMAVAHIENLKKDAELLTSIILYFLKNDHISGERNIRIKDLSDIHDSFTRLAIQPQDGNIKLMLLKDKRELH